MEERLIAAMAEGCVDSQDLDDEAIWEQGIEDGQEEEEEVVYLDEAEAFRMLDAAEPPLSVCSRLFLETPSTDGALLSAAAAAHLRAFGWAVLPSLLSEAEAAAARAAALSLPPGALQQPPSVSGITDTTARSDLVLFLHPSQPPSTPGSSLAVVLSRLAALRHELGNLLRLDAPEPEFQLGVYPGGGAAYARHRDAFPDDGSTRGMRRLTCVAYCNAPDSDCRSGGGALRLFVPGRQAEKMDEQLPACVDASSATHVDITPVGGACVIFLSGAVEHEVLPCSVPRVAVTAWMG